MKTKVLLTAPLLTLSGYGEQGRFAFRALMSRQDKFDVYIKPLNWGQCGWLHEDNEERRMIDEILKKTIMHEANGGTFDVSVQCTIPNEWSKIAPINIGYTAGIETTRVAPEWLQASNENVDRIIVVSDHSKHVFESTKYEMRHPDTNSLHGELGLQVPIDSVNYPVKKFEPVPEVANYKFGTKFNILCVAQMGPRKNLEATIGCFIDEFKDDADVGLVVKTFAKNNSLIDREETSVLLKRLLSNAPEHKCKVHLLHGALSDAEMNSLYTNRSIKGLITLTHGEGFGLPIFEAAYNGVPVIAPAWSGHMDFLMAPSSVRKKGERRQTPHMLQVDYTLGPIPQEVVWEGVITESSMWCNPDLSSARKQMRNLKEDYKRHKTKATKLKKHIHNNFTEQKMYGEFVSSVEAAIGTNSSVPENVQVFT